MLASVLLLAVILQAPSPSATAPAAPAPKPPAQAAPKPSVDADDPNALLKVKRIYVDSFGDDVISKELQSMIVTALVDSKRFKVTENKERADAILKGVALEKTSHEVHAYGEGTSVGAAAGSGHADSSSANAGFIAKHMGISDSALHTETINDARVAIRLVTPDGDVIWTSTQESKGAKYKSSSADVADQCVKDLLRSVEKLEHANPAALVAPVNAVPGTHTTQPK